MHVYARLHGVCVCVCARIDSRLADNLWCEGNMNLV